jgi:hypothetical protein
MGEAARIRSPEAVRVRRAVGGRSWLAHFMRARLTEVGLGIAVLAGIALPFEKLASLLLLSSPGDAGPVTLTVQNLAPGSYWSFDGRHSRLYVVRTAEDDVVAFTVPLKGGKVEMPTVQWGRSGYDCSDFGPDSSGGVLGPESVFRCRDPATPPWGAARWRWDLDGSPAPLIDDTYIGALPRVTSVRSNGQIRIYRWDIQW